VLLLLQLLNPTIISSARGKVNGKHVFV